MSHMINEFATMCGPNQVLYYSPDDKCRVPIGVVCAHKQQSVMMGVERTRLPDHDYVVAPKHKLIPSVIALCESLVDELFDHFFFLSHNIVGVYIVTSNKISYRDVSGVTSSGPTKIVIRSAIDNSSSAETHAIDIREMIDNNEFPTFTHHENQVKPIWVVRNDGGADENCRFAKVQDQFITDFKRYDLDFLVVHMYPSGDSKYNQCERRMAPLSRALSYVILLY